MRLKETTKYLCSQVMYKLENFTLDDLRKEVIKEHPDFYWSEDKIYNFVLEFLQEKKVDVEGDKFIINDIKLYEKGG